jgi:hypothetical protein
MEKKKVRRYSVWAMYVAIWLVFRNFPTFTERFYSNGIYPYIAKLLHLAFGWVPFSFGDILYTLFIIGLLGAIIKHFRKVWQKPLWLLDKIVAKIITIIVAFFFLWGFNYFRIPLAQQLNVNTKYSAEQLYKATESCIIRANALHFRLADTDSSKVTLPFSNREIYRIAAESYPLNITNITDFTAIKSVKSSVYSKLLTYMGYSGYLNPFTNEAQVNSLMIGYSIPITACHEIAHQMGYAAEEEANYLGYLAAMKADNPYFKYSAELFALRCFLNEVAVLSPEKYDELQAQVRKGIFENYKEVRLFWQQYKNKAEPIFKSSYDVFLKANKQVAGINSYDLVTGLLIPHYAENTD